MPALPADFSDIFLIFSAAGLQLTVLKPNDELSGVSLVRVAYHTLCDRLSERTESAQSGRQKNATAVSSDMAMFDSNAFVPILNSLLFLFCRVASVLPDRRAKVVRAKQAHLPGESLGDGKESRRCLLRSTPNEACSAPNVCSLVKPRPLVRDTEWGGGLVYRQSLSDSLSSSRGLHRRMAMFRRSGPAVDSA